MDTPIVLNPNPAPPEPAPDLPKSSKHLPVSIVVASLGLLVLAVAGGVFVYWYYNNSPTQQASPINNAPNTVVVTNNPYTPPQPTPTTTTTPQQTPTQPLAAAPSIINCSNTPPASKLGLVQWQNPQSLSDLGLVDDSSDNADYAQANYFQLGTFVAGKYQGGTIILGDFEPNGPAIQNEFDEFVKLNGHYIELGKYSGYFDTSNPNFTADSNFDLPDLDFPSTLHSTSPQADYTLDTANALFDCTGLVKIFTDPVAGNIYAQTNEASSSSYTLFDRSGFYAEAPDGTTRAYQMVIPLIDNNSHLALVTWNDGQKNNNEYSYQQQGGCGAKDYRNIADVTLQDLQQTGTTLTGQPVYEYKNIHAPDLQSIYDNMYVPDGQTKPSYAAFIASHPIFFWQDPFGNFIQIQSLAYQPMAECGKPVIYLYPQQTEKVSVNINPVGGMTESIPSYNGGWNVIADPNSDITNLADGQLYSYLFWEGTGGIYQTPNKGFVVSQAGVHQLLENKLSLLGLNQKERQDFENFWEPKMQSSPYYFVTFMGNDVMNEIAPLSISPKPDTIIRVLMDFTPLEHQISIEGYNIITPVRKGFTVVEWGGVLR